MTESQAAQQDTYQEFDFAKTWRFVAGTEDPLSLRF
jgi:hypothetical protein